MTLWINGEERPLRGETLAELLADLAHDATRPGFAVALNDEVVPRSEWPRTTVRPGDRVEIVCAVAGG